MTPRIKLRWVAVVAGAIFLLAHLPQMSGCARKTFKYLGVAGICLFWTFIRLANVDDAADAEKRVEPQRCGIDDIA